MSEQRRAFEEYFKGYNLERNSTDQIYTDPITAALWLGFRAAHAMSDESEPPPRSVSGDKLLYFIKAWEMNGVGTTVVQVQDSPDTTVALTLDDLRRMLANLASGNIAAEFWRKRAMESDDESEATPVEVWHGERKVTIYDHMVLRSWGTNINTEMSDEPRTSQAVQNAMEWLFADESMGTSPVFRCNTCESFDIEQVPETMAPASQSAEKRGEDEVLPGEFDNAKDLIAAMKAEKRGEEVPCEHEWEPMTEPHKECVKCGDVRRDWQAEPDITEAELDEARKSIPAFEKRFEELTGRKFSEMPDLDQAADYENPAPMYPPCAGMNCGATDGKSHSPECRAEYAATIAGGRFVKDKPVERE